MSGDSLSCLSDYLQRFPDAYWLEDQNRHVERWCNGLGEDTEYEQEYFCRHCGNWLEEYDGFNYDCDCRDGAR